MSTLVYCYCDGRQAPEGWSRQPGCIELFDRTGEALTCTAFAPVVAVTGQALYYGLHLTSLEVVHVAIFFGTRRKSRTSRKRRPSVPRAKKRGRLRARVTKSQLSTIMRKAARYRAAKGVSQGQAMKMAWASVPAKGRKRRAAGRTTARRRY